MDSEVAVLDDHPLPHGGYDLVLRNQVAASIKQEGKDVERTGAEDDQNLDAVLTAPEQATAPAIEAKVREQEYVARGESLHVSPAEAEPLDAGILHRFRKIRKNSDRIR